MFVMFVPSSSLVRSDSEVGAAAAAVVAVAVAEQGSRDTGEAVTGQEIEESVTSFMVIDIR
jgi:hypothetical protein